MSGKRNVLPQLDSGPFLTDGGLETTLIYHHGLELPHFAAFGLLKRSPGRAALRSYFRTYADLARRFGVGLVLESATWRANPDWAAKLGYSRKALADANRDSITLLEEIRAEVEAPGRQVVISGCLGPRGDGYEPRDVMSEAEAEAYHREQIETFAATSATMVSAFTINYAEEAIGIARAAGSAQMPVVISFTVETGGTLPTGETLKSAIGRVDAATSSYPIYFMINCAHPTHFENILAGAEPWTQRIRGLRANASRKSHAQLDNAAALDAGDPAELGTAYARLKRHLPNLNVLGGCCGTDHRHIEGIFSALTTPQKRV